jgi:hypothetical protein
VGAQGYKGTAVAAYEMLVERVFVEVAAGH